MGKGSNNKSTKIKVFPVGNRYDAMWLPRDRYEIVNEYDRSDILVFPGGSDWNPALYNEKTLHTTGFHEAIDKPQLSWALKAIADGKFMIGICRGGQMLTILAGGRLIQDVNNHGGRNHNIYTFDNLVLETNSLHHQMMDTILLPKKHVNVLAWTPPLSTHYQTGNGEATIAGIPYREGLEKENEVLYFNQIGGFAIQGHPEMNMSNNCRNWIIEQIEAKYEEWQSKKHISIPEYIVKRLDHVESVYWKSATELDNSTNNIITKQKKDEQYETDWNPRGKATGHWSY